MCYWRKPWLREMVLQPAILPQLPQPSAEARDSHSLHLEHWITYKCNAVILCVVNLIISGHYALAAYKPAVSWGYFPCWLPQGCWDRRGSNWSSTWCSKVDQSDGWSVGNSTNSTTGLCNQKHWFITLLKFLFCRWPKLRLMTLNRVEGYPAVYWRHALSVKTSLNFYTRSSSMGLSHHNTKSFYLTCL